MIIFQPHGPRQTYYKQILHSDELPYFSCGSKQIFLRLYGYTLAPAICYESLIPRHLEHASENGADFYIASVAKSDRGIKKAFDYFPEQAKNHSMTILMSNCIGPSDDFISVGKTSIWSRQGDLIGQLDETSEGLLILDTATQQVLAKTIELS